MPTGTYVGLYLKFSLFGQTLINVRMCSKILVKFSRFCIGYWSAKLYRFFLCGRTEWRTDWYYEFRVYFQVLFRRLQKLQLLEVIFIEKKIKAENVLFYTKFYTKFHTKFYKFKLFNLINYMDSNTMNGCKRTNTEDCYFR